MYSLIMKTFRMSLPRIYRTRISQMPTSQAKLDKIQLYPILSGKWYTNNLKHTCVYRSYCRVQLGEAIERKALGRVGELGQFYDARTEQFISGKIFNRALPYDAVKTTNTLPMTPPSFECVTNETLPERLEKLHVEPELKVITYYLSNIYNRHLN